MAKRKQNPQDPGIVPLVEKPDISVKIFTPTTEAESMKEMRELVEAHRKPVVHTYFSACDGISMEPELRLLLKWISWMENIGYEVRVLNESHARRHPKYEQYRAKVDSFPSVNPRDYERANWLRWLALSVAGGGAAMDYDCFARERIRIPVGDDFTVFEGESSANACPSLASGTRVAIEKLIDYVMGHPDGYAYSEKRKSDDRENGTHFSDMICMRDLPGLKVQQWVKQYTSPGFETAAFVHCSHSATVKDARPRHKHVDRIMALKETT